MRAVWRVERTMSTRFPFRIAIEQGGRTLLAVRAASAWPAPGAQIFCLREAEEDPGEHLVLEDEVPVAHLARIGPKLAIVLDRPARKRCEFLFLRKPRKNGDGTYEQVFLRTETALRAHRSKGRVELPDRADMDVVIDLQERYPWRFPEARTARRRLAVGDYALVRDERILALAERKSFENLCSDFGAIRALHHTLSELAAQPRAALVIEAQYGDFLDPARTQPWPAAHTARVLAEISALHPTLPVVFAGNRKLANAWVVRWFTAVAASESANLPLFVAEVAQRYEAPAHADGLDQRLREAALVRLPTPFKAAALRGSVPGATPERVTRVLNALRREGRLETRGRGPGTVWERVARPRRSPAPADPAAPRSPTRP